MVLVAVAIARRTSLASADARLLVVAGGQRWCAAIDLESGALVTARWSGAVPALETFAVADVRVAPDQSGADPTRPEELVLAAPPTPVGVMGKRGADRWLRPLLHPESEHLLGSAGPTVPYWTLTGEHPSVAIVRPASPPVILASRCRFRWRHVDHVLPVLATAMGTCPSRPRRVLVALTPPRHGRCYKVVAALL